LALLNQIQDFFGVGKVRMKKDGYAEFCVQSVKDLTSIIIPHFTKSPLITKK
jgi:hypothetical protein